MLPIILINVFNQWCSLFRIKMQGWRCVTSRARSSSLRCIERTSICTMLRALPWKSFGTRVFSRTFYFHHCIYWQPTCFFTAWRSCSYDPLSGSFTLAPLKLVQTIYQRFHLPRPQTIGKRSPRPELVKESKMEKNCDMTWIKLVTKDRDQTLSNIA